MKSIVLAIGWFGLYNAVIHCSSISHPRTTRPGQRLRMQRNLFSLFVNSLEVWPTISCRSTGCKKSKTPSFLVPQPWLSSKALWFAATSQKCERLTEKHVEHAWLILIDCLQAVWQRASGSGNLRSAWSGSDPESNQWWEWGFGAKANDFELNGPRKLNWILPRVCHTVAYSSQQCSKSLVKSPSTLI